MKGKRRSQDAEAFWVQLRAASTGNLATAVFRAQPSTKGASQGWKPSPMHLSSSWREDTCEAVLGPAISSERGFTLFKLSFELKHQVLNKWMKM